MYSALLAVVSGFALISSSFAAPVLDNSLVSRQYFNNDPEVYDAGQFLVEQMNLASAQLGSVNSQNADNYFDGVSVMGSALDQTFDQLAPLPYAPSGPGKLVIAQTFDTALSTYFGALVNAQNQAPDFVVYYYELDFLTAQMLGQLQRTSAGTLEQIASTGGSFCDVFHILSAGFPETSEFLSKIFSGST